MAVLGLRFCARAFSSCDKWGPLFIAVRGPLTVAASLVAEHRLQTCRLSNCGSRAQLLCGMWDLPRPGLEPVSPALAGRFSTTVPPGKASIATLNVSGLSTPIKRHRVALWIIQETHFRAEDTQTESEGTERDISCKWKQNGGSNSHIRQNRL